MITHKNLQHFIQWANKKTSLCRLSNGLTCFFEKKLYFFFSKIMFIDDKDDKSEIILNIDTKPNCIISKWLISIEKTTECIKNQMTFDDLLVGNFAYTEPVDNQGNLSVKFHLEKKDNTRKIFSKLDKFSEIIPKCSCGTTGSDTYVKVNLFIF